MQLGSWSILIRNNSIAATTALLNVIRGEARWPSLQEVGFDVSRTDGEWSFGPPRGDPLQPSVQDLRQALTHLSSPDLDEWASFILAASNLVDLTVVGNDEDGAEIIERLWDIAFSKSPGALPSEK